MPKEDKSPDNLYNQSEDNDYIPIINEYDIVATPNDFNLGTLINFFEKNKIELPEFQRSYVWDKKNASKFIESLLVKLPIPQIFLYQNQNNKYSILDGQQRLLSIYFFYKGFFPKKEKRGIIRDIIIKEKNISDDIFNNSEYFEEFNLKFSSNSSAQKNPFEGFTFDSLSEEKKDAFLMMTLRTFVIKQNQPKNDDTAIYEMYDRLNTGGRVLKPQEIRANLYQSDFYKMLYELNDMPQWRKILTSKDKDIHMRDIESLLRIFSLLMDFDNYQQPMTNFLNLFSNKMKMRKDRLTNNDFFSGEQIMRAKELFLAFLNSVEQLDENSFINSRNQFSNTLFEAIFLAVCDDLYKNQSLDIKKDFKKISQKYIADMKEKASNENENFYKLSVGRSASKENIEKRINIAKELLSKEI